MKIDHVPYDADGLKMIGALYSDDDSSRRPGVLLFPEAFGPGPNVHGRAERIVQLGYTAFVCDLHGGGALIEDFPKVMELVQPLRASTEKLRARATGALDALRSLDACDNDRVAAVGFCIGGTLALELGRSGAQLRSIVGFHPGLATGAPEDATHIRGEVLVCVGADDPSVPIEQRIAFESEMKATKVDWTMHVYGGVVHAFTNRDAELLKRPEFARFDGRADRLSWEAMVALLARTLTTENR